MNGYGKDFLYIRYVDDILIIAPPESLTSIDNEMQKVAKTLGVKISRDKSDKEHYTTSDFEQENLSEDVIKLCKRISAMMDLFYSVPNEYYVRRCDVVFLKEYSKCLKGIGINIPDRGFLSKKLNMDNYRGFRRSIKEKQFGKENIDKVISLKRNLNLPQDNLWADPDKWSQHYRLSNSEITMEINETKEALYKKMHEVFEKFKKHKTKKYARELKSMLFRAKYYYDSRYKELSKQLLEEYPYVAPYNLLLELVSGAENDAQQYYVRKLLEIINTREKLKDNYLLVAHIIRHLADRYPNTDTFEVLSDTIGHLFAITDIKLDGKSKDTINENLYRISYPSGYLILLLAVTEAILYVPHEYWSSGKKSILFQHLQTLLSLLHIEQIYKGQQDKILYSFKKALKRNIVSVMAKMLNSQEFVDLNLFVTPEYVKRILKQYVNGAFSFSDYILSISENHNPDEYTPDEENIGFGY